MKNILGAPGRHPIPGINLIAAMTAWMSTIKLTSAMLSVEQLVPMTYTRQTAGNSGSLICTVSLTLVTDNIDAEASGEKPRI